MVKIVIIFILLLSSLYSKVSNEKSLKRVYYDSKASNFQPITPKAYVDSIELFRKVLQKAPTPQEVQELSKLGIEIGFQSKTMIALSTGSSMGQGFFIIRYGLQGSIANMLSIPHRFYDKYTGVIGYKLMQKGSYRAIAFNTLHRKVVDMAHTPQTLFSAFHIAYGRNYPNESIYQLHGYSPAKRQKSKESKAHMIVSGAKTSPTLKAASLNRCFENQGYFSMLYGKDTFELGGTTNTQANLLAQIGYNNFIHIEINTLLREALKTSDTKLQTFRKCLL